MTVVGDLAQRSIGEPGTWAQHLPPSVPNFAYRELSVNYRTPAEVAELAAAVLAELAPELAPPISIRNAVHPPETANIDLSSLPALVRRVRAETAGGEVAVIGADANEQQDIAGVRWLTPWQAKGLEFDAVIVVEPSRMLRAENGLSLLFVALTRTTDRLTIAHSEKLPEMLASAEIAAKAT